VIPIDDLDQAVEDLRKMGFEACHEFVYGPRGCLEGLDVGEDFFPVWELMLPENQDDLARADFEAIKARRGPDWSAERPKQKAAAV